MGSCEALEVRPSDPGFWRFLQPTDEASWAVVWEEMPWRVPAHLCTQLPGGEKGEEGQLVPKAFGMTQKATPRFISLPKHKMAQL